MTGNILKLKNSQDSTNTWTVSYTKISFSAKLGNEMAAEESKLYMPEFIQMQMLSHIVLLIMGIA